MVPEDPRCRQPTEPKHNVPPRGFVAGAPSTGSRTLRGMSAIPATFLAFVAEKVERDGAPAVERGERTFAEADLPAGEVEIRVAWSSVNYKDGLATRADGRVARISPLIPGIDLAGEVIASADPAIEVGSAVLAHGYDLGVSRHGGFSEYQRVPAGWVVPLAPGLTPRDAMAIGTAGFTAGMSVVALEDRGLTPTDGPVLVTGASGGVGGTALAILADRGFEVWAVTGKPEEADRLRALGAAGILTRDEVAAEGKPLELERWAGAIDAVGAATLPYVLRTLKTGATVAASGNAGGPKLDTTVFPFILRGVALLGMDSVTVPIERRRRIWDRAGDGPAAAGSRSARPGSHVRHPADGPRRHRRGGRSRPLDRPRRGVNGAGDRGDRGALTQVATLAVDRSTARIHEHGWQSWTATSSYPLDDRGPRAWDPVAHVMSMRPGAPEPPRGSFQGDGLLAIQVADGGPVHVFASPDGTVAVDTVRATLVPGRDEVPDRGRSAGRASRRQWLGRDPGRSRSLGRWCRRTARTRGATTGTDRVVFLVSLLRSGDRIRHRREPAGHRSARPAHRGGPDRRWLPARDRRLARPVRSLRLPRRAEFADRRGRSSRRASGSRRSSSARAR